MEETKAFWVDPSFVEHATGEVIHLGLQYLEQKNYDTYLEKLKSRNYTLMYSSNGRIKALSPLHVSRSQVSKIMLTPVNSNRPRTPEQQLAYEERDTVIHGQVIGSAD